MSESNYISIKGAKVNNLKNIDVNIPREQAGRHHGTIRFRKIILGF